MAAAAQARSGQLLEQRTGLHVEVALSLPPSHPLSTLQRELPEAVSVPLLKVATVERAIQRTVEGGNATHH